MSVRILTWVLGALVAGTIVNAQVAPHKIVPLNNIPSEQWVEVLSGEPGTAGSPFVLRIHNDPG